MRVLAFTASILALSTAIATAQSAAVLKDIFSKLNSTGQMMNMMKTMQDLVNCVPQDVRSSVESCQASICPASSNDPSCGCNNWNKVLQKCYSTVQSGKCPDFSQKIDAASAGGMEMCKSMNLAVDSPSSAGQSLMTGFVSTLIGTVIATLAWS
jgi:hypothetical protein